MQFIDSPIAFYQHLYYNCHCCNAGQSKEERRLKYAIVRYLGLSRYDAMKFRDWNRQPFAKRFGYSNFKSMLENLNLGVLMSK